MLKLDMRVTTLQQTLAGRGGAFVDGAGTNDAAKGTDSNNIILTRSRARSSLSCDRPHGIDLVAQGGGAVTGDTGWPLTVKGAFSDTAAAVSESVVVSDFL